MARFKRVVKKYLVTLTYLKILKKGKGSNIFGAVIGFCEMGAELLETCCRTVCIFLVSCGPVCPSKCLMPLFHRGSATLHCSSSAVGKVGVPAFGGSKGGFPTLSAL